jgi:hypothetical protein
VWGTRSRAAAGPPKLPADQLRVSGDAVWALCHVRDCYRDQLLGLLLERARAEDSPAELLERLVDFRGKLLSAPAELGRCGGVYAAVFSHRSS